MRFVARKPQSTRSGFAASFPCRHVQHCVYSGLPIRVPAAGFVIGERVAKLYMASIRVATLCDRIPEDRVEGLAEDAALLSSGNGVPHSKCRVADKIT